MFIEGLSMINSVNSSSYTQNPFRDFSKNRDVNFFMTQTQTEDTKKKSHRGRNLAFAIGSSALIVGAGLLLLSRGLPKSTSKHLENIKEFLEKRLEKSAIKGSDYWNEFYVYSLRKVNTFIDKAQSINNFSSLKDILFKNIMNKNKNTARIHKKISDFFERISRRTVKGAYKSTGKKFSNMFTSFDNLDARILKTNPNEIITINGQTHTKYEWLKIAKQHRENIKGAVESFISAPKQTGRYRHIKTVTSKLYEQFWDESFKDFWSKNNKFRRKEMWQTFIPEEKISAGKTLLADQVAAVRNKITYTNADKINLMDEHLKKLEELILPSDREGLDIVKKLKWFLKNPGGLAENTDVFKKELTKLMDRPLQEGLDKSIIANQQNLRKSYFKSITDLIDSKNSGELQEMLSIYEKIAPYELSLIRPQVTKAVASFDKSLNLETVEFFDKVRDLELGSAPTDLLSIVASGGMIAYGLTKAKDSDERMSVTLKAGIPIVGAIATSLFCTARLISGGKSMVFGAVSGFVLNQIGNLADTIRKKFGQKQAAAAQKNPTNSQVA